jgi:hypothetical protein
MQISVPGGIFGGLRVNGMPAGTLALRIEGQDATQTTWSAAYGMSQPSVDAIEETAIQTSNFAAEFGQVGGGMFNMTMKSGTNELQAPRSNTPERDDVQCAPAHNHYTPATAGNDWDFGRRPVFLPKISNGRINLFFSLSRTLEYGFAPRHGSHQSYRADQFACSIYRKVLGPRALAISWRGL